VFLLGTDGALMSNVPDGEVDPDTGHCKGAKEGGCAEAASVTFLWAAGITTSENHLDFAIVNNGPGGTKIPDLEAGLRNILVGTPWMITSGAVIDAAAKAVRALLIEVEWPDGLGHMICIIPDGDGVWVHDPAEDDRIRATWEQVAAYKIITTIRLVEKESAHA